MKIDHNAECPAWVDITPPNPLNSLVGYRVKIVDSHDDTHIVTVKSADTFGIYSESYYFPSNRIKSISLDESSRPKLPTEPLSKIKNIEVKTETTGTEEFFVYGIRATSLWYLFKEDGSARSRYDNEIISWDPVD